MLFIVLFAGPEGVLIQQHHYQAVPTNPSSEDQIPTQSIGQSQGSNGQSHEVVSVRSTSPVADLAIRFNSKGGMTRSASQIAFQDRKRPSSLFISLCILITRLLHPSIFF